MNGIVERKTAITVIAQLYQIGREIAPLIESHRNAVPAVYASGVKDIGYGVKLRGDDDLPLFHIDRAPLDFDRIRF